MTSRTLGHRSPLLWLVLPFAAGLVAGRLDWTPAPPASLAAATGLIGVALGAAARSPRGWAAALTTGLFFAGCAGYTLHRNRLDDWDRLPAREARLGLQIERVFAGADTRKINGLAVVVRTDPHLAELAGQHVYFSLAPTAGEPEPIRSAIVAAIGVLAALPRSPPSDSFDGYLADSGVNFRLTRGRILGPEVPASAYYRGCARAAAWCHTILGEGLAAGRPELAGLLRAMMLGSTHDLSTEQRTLFMQSGTMHLFAISGLNIGVIATALQALLTLTRLPAAARFTIATGLLWVFVDITGASPSAVRAFAMATLLQAALVLHRPGNLLAALVVAAFAVQVAAPLQVFSASFLMSYGIVLALLLHGAPLAESWQARWSLWRGVPQVTWSRWQHAAAWLWRTALSALAVGVATTLVSLLTGVQFFQLLTPGAFTANLVLIPAAMIVTLGGFASLLCGLVAWPGGADLCNHAAALVLFLIEQLVRVSVRVPGAFLPAHYGHSWIGPLALGLVLAALLFGYTASWKGRAGGWWPPVIIVALTLLFGIRFG